MTNGSNSRRFSPEVSERAVRMVGEHAQEHASQWAAMVSIAAKIGCTAPTRIKALERENRELRQANEILRKASACSPIRSTVPTKPR